MSLTCMCLLKAKEYKLMVPKIFEDFRIENVFSSPDVYDMKDYLWAVYRHYVDISKKIDLAQDYEEKGIESITYEAMEIYQKMPYIPIEEALLKLLEDTGVVASEIEVNEEWSVINYSAAYDIRNRRYKIAAEKINRWPEFFMYDNGIAVYMLKNCPGLLAKITRILEKREDVDFLELLEMDLEQK